jgi:DUF971 family protein
MIIQIDPTLPCAQLNASSPSAEFCRESATQAVIAPASDGTWEMLPVCSNHLFEVTLSFGHDVAAFSL